VKGGVPRELGSGKRRCAKKSGRCCEGRCAKRTGGGVRGGVLRDRGGVGGCEGR
jgi:hypothetical protein